VSFIRLLATALFIVSIPVAIVTTNIRLVANEARVYRYAIDEFDGPATTGISRDELLRASGEIRDYFNNDAKTLDIRVERNGLEVPLFNERETAHMADVKDRFRDMNKAQEFSVMYILSYIAIVVLWAREVTVRSMALQVAFGSLLSLAVVGTMAAVGLAGFDSAWGDFHQVLFTNDFWQLNPSRDHLIQMYPPDFWESIVFFLGTMIAAEAIVLIIGAGIYIGASRHHAQQRLQATLVLTSSK
jgi:integral membrane protein (TIGR01906 family)